MGDRANVLVKDDYDTNGVYLYTHWGGYKLPKNLQKALIKNWRWDDMCYLSRIIFDCMVDGEHDRETGFGISSKVGDGENRILVVDCSTQTVSFNKKIWTFEEYVHLSEDEINKVWQ